MPLFSYSRSKKNANRSKETSESAGAPNTVQDTVSVAQPSLLQIPSGRPSMTQQPDAGPPNSSTSTLTTQGSDVSTPSPAGDTANTPKAPRPSRSLLSFLKLKKSAAKPTKLKKQERAPETVQTSVSPAQPSSLQPPTIQVSMVQQSAAGTPSSSTPDLATQANVSATPTSKKDAPTPEALRQAHAEGSQKYEKVSDTSLLFLNTVKDFSESNEMFAPLKATMALLIRGLETARTLHDNNNAWNELLEDLNPWVALMKQIDAKLGEKGSLSASDQDLKRAVDKYTEVVNEAIKEVTQELEKLAKKEFKTQAKRVGTIKIDPERMKRIRQKLDAAHKMYSTSAVHVTINKVDDVGTNVTELRGEIHQVLNIKDQSRLVMECTIEEFTYGHQSRQTCHPETRKELLAKLKQWEEEVQGKEQIFWIKDDAGRGKTTIASTKSSEWIMRGCMAAQMYCPSETKEVPKIKDIIQHLAVQLVSFGSIRELVVKLLRETHIHHPSKCFQSLVSEPLQKLNQPNPVFLIIDAVDNLRPDERDLLVKILAKQVSETPSVKVLITSRQSLDILLDLKSAGLLYGASEHSIASDRSNAEDIKHYVYSELWQSRFSDRDRDVVVRYSDGHFEVASQICHQLAQSRRLKQTIEALAKGDGSMVGMDGLLTNTLREAFKDKNKKEQNDALDVLRVLVTCFEPLSIEGGFSHLLDRSKSDRNDEVVILLHALQDLAVLERADNDLQPLVLRSEYLKQYICSEEKAGEFYMDPNEAHSYLGGLCIKRLSEVDALRYNVLGVRRAGYRLPKNSDITNLEDRVKKALGEGWRYAAKSWLKHILDAGGVWEEWTVVLDFLSKHFLHWIELASWMDNLDDAITSLTELQTVVTDEMDYAPGSEKLILEELSRFLQVGLKYVVRYKEIIKESALHVYTLLITLEPSEARLLRPNDATGHKSPKFITSEPIKWDTDTSSDGSAIGIFVDHESYFLGATRSPTDGPISVWRVNDDGAVREALLDIAASVTSWATNGEELVTVGPRGVQIYDLATKSPSTKVRADFSVSKPKTVTFSADGTHLAISSAKMTQVWDYKESQLVWSSGKDGLRAISFAPEGDDLAIAGQRGDKLVLFDQGTSTELEGPSSEHEYVQTAIHPTENLVLAAQSRSLEVWATDGDHLKLIAQADLDGPASASYPLQFTKKKEDYVIYGSWVWRLEKNRDRTTSLVRCEDTVTTCKVDGRRMKHSLLTYEDGWIHSAYHAGPIMPVPPQLRAAFDSKDGWTAKGETILGWMGPNKPVLIDCSPLLTAA